MIQKEIELIDQKISKESAFIDDLFLEINKTIIGQKSMIDRLLIGLLGSGHILLEGVPGLAKTLAINTLSKAIKGDFGTSFQNSVAVGPEVAKRIPVTIFLASLAFGIAILIAVPLGALAGMRHQKLADGTITTLATLFGSTPNFWLATLLIYLLALKFGWFPTGGYVPFQDSFLGSLKSLCLPAISLGLVSSGLLIRIMRAAVIETMESNHIDTAISKGVGPRRLFFRHVLRNSIIPFLTVGAVEFGFLVGSVVIIEDVFRIPGIGSLVLVGIINRDYPVLLAASMAITLIVLLVNFLADLSAQLIDPRQVKNVRN